MISVLALSIADDATVRRRLHIAMRDGDKATIAACRMEIVHRNPLQLIAETINAQRDFERGLTRRG